MINEEDLKDRLSNYIEKMIQDAYRSGFSDGWRKSTEFHCISEDEQINSNEYVIVMSECLKKYDENYELKIR